MGGDTAAEAVDIVARRVLYLPRDERVSSRQQAELLVLVAHAEAEQRAGTLEALGAFNLERNHGVLRPQTLLPGADGSNLVRDLTAVAPRDLDLTTVRVLGRDGSLRPPTAAAWPTGSLYVLLADGGPHHVDVPSGERRLKVPWSDVAELVRQDLAGSARMDNPSWSWAERLHPRGCARWSWRCRPPEKGCRRAHAQSRTRPGRRPGRRTGW
ncbi:hypothetical protein [Streptomyces griseorubiginosus]